MNLPLNFLIVNMNYIAILMWFFGAVYIGYVFITLYHLTRFGVGQSPKVFSVVFFVGSIFFLILLLVAYISIDFNIISDSINEIFKKFNMDLLSK